MSDRDSLLAIPLSRSLGATALLAAHKGAGVLLVAGLILALRLAYAANSVETGLITWPVIVCQCWH